MDIALGMFAGIGLFIVGIVIGMTIGTDDTVDAEFEDLDGVPIKVKNKK